MPAGGAKKKGAKSGVVDVVKPADVKSLNDLFKKHKVVLVLVWADYCGHCKTYKDEVWNNLVNLPNRTAGLGTVHYDQLENTPLAGSKLDGYPSVLIVGKDKRAAEFEENGASTNALPNARDMNMMTKLATEEPEVSVNSLPNLKSAPNFEAEGEANASGSTFERNASGSTFEPDETTNNSNTSVGFDKEAESIREEHSKELAERLASGEEALTNSASRIAASQNRVSVPSMDEDVLDTQGKSANSTVFNASERTTNEKPKGSPVGGALYKYLEENSRKGGAPVEPKALIGGGAKRQRSGGRRKGRTARRRSRRSNLKKLTRRR